MKIVERLRMATAVFAAVAAILLFSSPKALALDPATSKFLMEAAEGGQTEVRLGVLAKSKASLPAVAEFGGMMNTDHTMMNEQLRTLASLKGVELPSTLSDEHQAEYDRLSKLAGENFDREYVKLMVTDHRKDVSEFQKNLKSTRDEDVKGLIQGALPRLQQHLSRAEKLARQLGVDTKS